MDKMGHFARAPEQWTGIDDMSVAETVARDFRGLVAMFNCHLESGFGAAGEELAILKAKAAAERGLQLSRRLLELTRNST
jgi:hypothetical protein